MSDSIWHATTWGMPDYLDCWEIAGGGFVSRSDFVTEEAEQMPGPMLFMYLFRRFGPSEWGSDDYKEVAAWYLTTPNPDVVLLVSPRPSSGKYSFGYGVNSDKYDNRRDPQQKAEVRAALQAAIEDLKSPVGLDDEAINAYGWVKYDSPDDSDPRLPHFKWAGCGVEHTYFDRYEEGEDEQMTDQPKPFDEKDVQLAWTDAVTPKVFVKKQDGTVCYTSMYWRINGRWLPCQPVMRDVEYLLRQLAEARQAKEKLRVLVTDIMERRGYAMCWYSDNGGDYGDCGNWPTCNPHCSLRQLMDMVGFKPQEDGGIDKQTFDPLLDTGQKEGESHE